LDVLFVSADEREKLSNRIKNGDEQSKVARDKNLNGAIVTGSERTMMNRSSVGK
jgi:hypothetical protein